LVGVGGVEEVPDEVEFLAVDVVEEVVGEAVEEGPVEANAPEEVAVEAGHGDGAVEALYSNGLLVVDLGFEVGPVPVAPDSGSPDYKSLVAELEESRDVGLLGVQLVTDTP